MHSAEDRQLCGRSACVPQHRFFKRGTAHYPLMQTASMCAPTAARKIRQVSEFKDDFMPQSRCSSGDTLPCLHPSKCEEQARVAEQ